MGADISYDDQLKDDYEGVTNIEREEDGEHVEADSEDDDY